jgi:hypothetical protein
MELETIGIDVGKTVFHLVGLNRAGEVVVRMASSSTSTLFAAMSPSRIGVSSAIERQWYGKKNPPDAHVGGWECSDAVRIAPAGRGWQGNEDTTGSAENVKLRQRIYLGCQFHEKPEIVMLNAVQPAVLTSWKEIAAYMGKGVRTVQRWEQDFGLPVRRAQGSNRKAVLARPHDIDAWIAVRCRTAACINGEGKSTTLHSRTMLSCEIETSRMLRQDHANLRVELSDTIRSLMETLATDSPRQPMTGSN